MPDSAAASDPSVARHAGLRRYSLRDVPIGQRFAAEGDLMGAAAAMKANACYSLGGMRGVARAEVLTQLGLTRQAAETYDAMKADHLMRTALAEPGFAVWVRSLLAKARLWKQLGERDKAMAAYQEFILRWKNADGAAAKLVGEAKQELGQLTDAPKKQ